MKRYMRIFFLLIAATALCGCMGSFLSYQGTKIKPDKLTKLQEGAQQGIFATNELAIYYNYRVMPEGLHMDGTVKVHGIGGRTILRLVVQLLFIDANGVVIKDSVLYSAPNHGSMSYAPLQFEKIMPVPEGAKAIAFTYDGLFQDGGGGGNASSFSIGYFPS